jgi:hypothetical protein
MEAWNYLLSIDAKFIEIKEPDRAWANKTQQHLKFAEKCHAYASEVSALAA